MLSPRRCWITWIENNLLPQHIDRLQFAHLILKIPVFPAVARPAVQQVFARLVDRSFKAVDQQAAIRFEQGGLAAVAAKVEPLTGLQQPVLKQSAEGDSGLVALPVTHIEDLILESSGRDLIQALLGDADVILVQLDPDPMAV